MFDLVTVGHFAIDFIQSPRSATFKPMLGGPPTYVSLAARKLDARVSVISKVGEDFSDEYISFLKANDVDLMGLKKVKGASTTKFILKYDNSRRKLQLRSRASPILPRDIPSSLAAKAAHLSPIVNEIPKEVVNRLRKQTNVLSLDPQGFVRRFDKKGDMRLSGRLDSSVLEQIDLYKSSQEELNATTGLENLYSAMREIQGYGAKIVIVTRGLKGSMLLSEGEFCEIPACTPRVVKDPTGAGDAFIGGFLAEYIQRNDPVWCGCVGAAAASFVIEGFGPTVFGGRQETRERASDIYDKVVFQTHTV